MIQTLTLIMISFMLLNFISTLTTYGSFTIFIKTSLDYCKYFLLVYIIIASKVVEGPSKTFIHILPLYCSWVCIGCSTIYGARTLFRPV